MSRKTPAGQTLAWRLCLPEGGPGGQGLLPFFIDWGDTAKKNCHPGQTAPQGLQLTNVLLTSPRPEQVGAALGKVGFPASVERGEEPAIVLEVKCPKGDKVRISAFPRKK